MIRKRTTIRTVGIIGAACGLLVAAIAPATASTSNQVVHHADGNIAGEVWFNSGNHAQHSVEDGAKYGFNSFTIKDTFCGDGWGIGVEWQLSDGVFTHRGTADDCNPPEITYETGQATTVVIEFNWRPFMWNVAGQYDTVYGAWQSDWMGSNSTEGDTDLFTRTSVHNDRVIDYEGDPLTFTATMWPTVHARLIGGGGTPAMWRDLRERTPLPPVLTADQRESMYKQLFCHALFAKHPWLGGDRWEIESARPNISWWRVLRGEGRCNW